MFLEGNFLPFFFPTLIAFDSLLTHATLCETFYPLRFDATLFIILHRQFEIGFLYERHVEKLSLWGWKGRTHFSQGNIKNCSIVRSWNNKSNIVKSLKLRSSLILIFIHTTSLLLPKNIINIIMTDSRTDIVMI